MTLINDGQEEVTDAGVKIKAKVVGLNPDCATCHFLNPQRLSKKQCLRNAQEKRRLRCFNSSESAGPTSYLIWEKGASI